MRAKTVNELYDQRRSQAYGKKLTVDQFLGFLEGLYNEFPNEDWENIVNVMVNNENDSDEDLIDYLIAQVDMTDDSSLIGQLIDKRDYFQDFRYAQHIEI